MTKRRRRPNGVRTIATTINVLPETMSTLEELEADRDCSISVIIDGFCEDYRRSKARLSALLEESKARIVEIEERFAAALRVEIESEQRRLQAIETSLKGSLEEALLNDSIIDAETLVSKWGIVAGRRISGEYVWGDASSAIYSYMHCQKYTSKSEKIDAVLTHLSPIELPAGFTAKLAINTDTKKNGSLYEAIEFEIDLALLLEQFDWANGTKFATKYYESLSNNAQIFETVLVAVYASRILKFKTQARALLPQVEDKEMRKFLKIDVLRMGIIDSTWSSASAQYDIANAAQALINDYKENAAQTYNLHLL